MTFSGRTHESSDSGLTMLRIFVLLLYDTLGYVTTGVNVGQWPVWRRSGLSEGFFLLNLTHWIFRKLKQLHNNINKTELSLLK